LALIENKAMTKKSDILCRPGKFMIDDLDIQNFPDTVLKIFGHVLVTNTDHSLMRRSTEYMGYSLLFKKVLENEDMACGTIPEYEFTIEATEFELVVKGESGDAERVIRF